MLEAKICALLALVVSIIIYIFESGNKLVAGGADNGLRRTRAQTIAKNISREIGITAAEKVAPTEKNFKKLCFPDEWKIQSQQKFPAEYMSPKRVKEHKVKEFVIFHEIGAGKTCAAIQIGFKWIRRGRSRPLILQPASLIPNFRDELRGECGKYANDDDFAGLSPTSAEYKELINESNARIDKDWNLMSFNKFVNLNKKPPASILIIDEVHNVTNTSGVYFREIVKYIENAPDMPVVVMSGTPIFDNSKELIGLMQILRMNVDDLEGVDEIDPSYVKRKFNGKVSYYPGAQKFTVPSSSINIVKCKMSAFQKKWYRSETERERLISGNLAEYEVSNNFYIKSRQRSNIVYPSGQMDEKGLEDLTKSLIKTSLKTYSAKFHKLMRKIRSASAKKELSFIYSNFTGPGGIKALAKILETYGYKNFNTEGEGRKRFAIWSGDQNIKEKATIKNVFNSPSNSKGELIEIVIGSPSIKEGVTLQRVRHVHIIEAYWNHSKLKQIYGRAIRFCVHKNLPRKKRNVEVYIYASYADFASPLPDYSIDLYMLELADTKEKNVSKHVKALKNTAVDNGIY